MLSFESEYKFQTAARKVKQKTNLGASGVSKKHVKD